MKTPDYQIRAIKNYRRLKQIKDCYKKLYKLIDQLPVKEREKIKNTIINQNSRLKHFES